MALILPKGIVVNSPQIGSTIERIKNDPLDLADIARFWKVYTTTKRRLLDPTAERLENYWWRIWGSRSRELDASTVARLFVHISEGDTFVPLRGPPNRYENEKPMNSAAYIGKTASTTSVARVRNDSRSSTTLTSVTRTPAPMPPPILKKTRGPSANGPRPTARFISPPASEDESGSTSTNKGVLQSPSPILEHAAPIEEKIEKEKVDRKLMPAPASKKFVASASKKKRPIVVRRQSSQTSQSSNDSSARVPGGQGQQNRTLGRLPTLSVLPVRNQNTQENAAPRSTTSPTKRNPSRSASSTLSGARKLASTREETVEIEPTQPGPSDNLQTLANNQVSVPQVSEAEFKVQRMLHDNVKTASMLPPETSSPNSPASTTSKDSSNGKPPGYRKSSGKNLLQHQSKGMVSSAPTLTDATGHLDLGNGSQIAAVPASPERPSKGKARALMKDLFTKKSFSQAAPSSPISGSLASSPSGPLSKSKSQLSLLLERDQARSLEPRTLPKHERKQSMK